MLTLNNEIQLNKYTQIASLPEQSTSFPPANTTAYALSWDFTSYEDNSTRIILRNDKLTVYDGSYCTKLNNITDWSKSICADGVYNCQIEGGPLFVVETQNGISKHIAAGLISNGIECFFSYHPR